MRTKRRHSQLSMMAPQDLRIVHAIPTDDPLGIQRYWLERFAPKVVKGKKELFRLTPDDCRGVQEPDVSVRST